MEASKEAGAPADSSRAKLNSRRKKKNGEVEKQQPSLSAEASEWTPTESGVVDRGNSGPKSDEKEGTAAVPKSISKAMSKIKRIRMTSTRTKKEKEADESGSTGSSSLVVEKEKAGRGGKGNKADSQVERSSFIEFECVICAREEVKYISFGKCNHPICSLCSMRMRFKGRDFSCSICKQELEVVLACSVDFGVSASARAKKKKQQIQLLKRGEKMDDRVDQKEKAGSSQKKEKEASLAPTIPTWESVSLAMGMEAGDALDETYPGVDSDPASRIMYVKCEDHYRDHQRMRSTACYVKGCKESFRSEAKLLRHLEEKHGHHLCQICVENRPLFITEHKVMRSKKEVQKHILEDPTKPGADKLGGHPECRFCKKHFFDASALYSHMVSQHHNCPMCPAQHQFRFYQTTRQLETHIREEHLVCETCFDLRAGRLVAFTRHAEYEDHMQRVHHVRNVSLQSLLASSMSTGTGSQSQQQRQQQGGRGGGGGGGGGGRQQGQERQYVELDMNSRDPNQVSTAALLQREIREANRAMTSHSHDLDIGGGGIAPIPANMQIAGQIVGGRLSRSVPGSQALQEASTAAYRQFTTDVRRQNNQLAYEQASEAFPSLSTVAPAAAAPSVGGGGNGSGPKLHAMSLVNKQREQGALRREKERVEAQKKREREEARLVRSRQLAQSFGVQNGLSFLPAPAPSSGSLGGGGDEDERSNTLMKRHADLLRPLYSDGLISWVRNNKHDVVRIERKMKELVEGEGQGQSLTSTQLKPMPIGPRMASHQLARYYGCNSFEYDYEPRRYVSIVKTAASAVPSLLLSQACELTAFPLYPGLREAQQPVVYFALLNGLYTKLGVNLEHGSNDQSLTVLSREDERDNTLVVPSTTAASAAGVVSIAFDEPSVALNRVWINEAGVSASQLCGYLASITKDNRGTTPLQDLRDVQPKGPNTVVITFQSLPAAWACASRVRSHYQSHKARLKELASLRRVPPTGRAHLLDLFEMELGFSEPEPVAASAGAEPMPMPESRQKEELGHGGVQSVAQQMQARERHRAQLEKSVQADWQTSTDSSDDADDAGTVASDGDGGKEEEEERVAFVPMALPWPLPRQAQRCDVDPYVSAAAAASGGGGSTEKEEKNEEDARFDFDKMRASSRGERRPLQLQPRAGDPPLPPPAAVAAAGGGGGISIYRPPRPSSGASAVPATAIAAESKAAPRAWEEEEPVNTGPANPFDILNSSDDDDDDNDDDDDDNDDDDDVDGGGNEHSGEGNGSDGEGAGGEQWACALCTFLNSNLLQECEMCGSPAV